MSAQFPALKPSSRNYSVGQIPTKNYRALSGATTKRSFGNRAYGYQIQLEYKNVPDTTTKQLLDHYNTTQGGFERFTLPDAVFAGMSTTLKNSIQYATAIQWEYSTPPDITSVFTDCSTVRISLVGELTY